jgi:hypothetical protein
MLRLRSAVHRLPALLIAILLAAPAWVAAQTEVREFAIRVDGAVSGQYRMTIQPTADGAITMAAQADAKVKVLLITAYSYSFSAVEVWKDGRLLRYDSNGAENGKRYVVSARTEGDHLRVTANGQEHPARADAWVNTYWRLPDARFRDHEAPLLGCDTGKEEARLLQYIGTERVNVAGQPQECTRYRIHTAPPHDLWFDAQGRLVRQEWTSLDGHRSILELKAIHR